jgi:hypothetical protein
MRNHRVLLHYIQGCLGETNNKRLNLHEEKEISGLNSSWMAIYKECSRLKIVDILLKI